jgi:hypothetical protein
MRFSTKLIGFLEKNCRQPMAAVIFMKRRGNHGAMGHDVGGTHDDTDEFEAAIRPASVEADGAFENRNTNCNPEDFTPSKMPPESDVIKKGLFLKYGGNDDWKPMEVVITAVGLYLAKPCEDLLREMIPLDEVLDVKKRNDVPESAAPETAGMQDLTAKQSLSSLSKDFLTESEKRSLYIIQIRTAELGYNSGRTYFFSLESEEDCDTWIRQIRSSAERALLLKRAGPGKLRQAKFRLRQVYRSVPAQSLVAILISCSFLVNILQTELVGINDGSDNSDYVAAFNVLEYLFTAAFAIELLVNMLAHFFLPFFKVCPPTATSLPLAHALTCLHIDRLFHAPSWCIL